MNIKRPLAPTFLEKLDGHLLLHSPETWSARTHLVLYYGLLFMAVLAGLCFIVPNDPRSDTQVHYWIGFLVIADIIALVVWLIYLLRFNLFKRYGNISAWGRLKTFGLYFVSIGTIVLFTYVPPAVETIRANMAYTDTEIINDINSINTKICQLEYDSLNHKWRADTMVLVNKVQKEPTVYSGDTLAPVMHYAYPVIDTADFNKRKLRGDSTVKLDDSSYIFYESPEYVFLKPYNFYDYSYNPRFTTTEQPNIKISASIYDSVIKNYQKPNEEKTLKELQALTKKYEYSDRYNYYSSYEPEPASYRDRMLKKYSIHATSRSMENILSRKHRWDSGNMSWQARTFFYCTLCLTLLVFIFRHSTVRTFFLSLLTAIVLTILSGLFLAFSYNTSESSIFAWIIFYTVVFGAASFTVFASSNRSIVSGIFINLFVLLVPFLSLTVVAYYYSSLKVNDYGYGLQHFDYQKMYNHFFYAELLDVILLVVLLPTLIHKMYRKWYALPEE